MCIKWIRLPNCSEQKALKELAFKGTSDSNPSHRQPNPLLSTPIWRPSRSHPPLFSMAARRPISSQIVRRKSQFVAQLTKVWHWLCPQATTQPPRRLFPSLRVVARRRRRRHLFLVRMPKVGMWLGRHIRFRCGRTVPLRGPQGKSQGRGATQCNKVI